MSTPPPPAPPPPPSGWEPPRRQEQQPQFSAGPVGYGPQRQDNGKATAALVVGILSVTCIPVVGSVIAIVLGWQAKREIDRSNGTQSGRGRAIAGLVLGWLGLALTVLTFLFFLLFADEIEEWSDEYEEQYEDDPQFDEGFQFESSSIAPLVLRTGLAAARALGV